MSVAILFWNLLIFVDVMSIAFNKLALLLAIFWVGLFIPAVVFTVQEENARHQQGKKGLGPPAVTALIATLVAPAFAGIVYSVVFALLSNQ